MKLIFKKILFLWTILFSGFLFADGVLTSINISNASSVNEADAGSQKMIFTVTLSESPFLWTTVDYSTQNGSATAGDDYVAKSGSITFLAWETTKTIEIDILDDAIDESDESLYVNISTSATGYEVVDGKGDGYIIDNELTPLALTLHTRTELESDNNWVLNFTARLNQPAPAGGVTLTYETRDNTAVAVDDYIATSGSITIPEGSINGYIPVTIVGDVIPENSENFSVKILSMSTGILFIDEATGTINDDDTIEVDISSSDVSEGNSGDSNQMIFRIFLTKDYPLTTPLIINYQTGDGSDPTATANVDYTVKNGTVTFNQGEIEKLVYIDIIGDGDIEPNEYLKMTISGSSYIINNNAQSKIINDDGSYPAFSFDNSEFSIVEGDSGQKMLEFNLTLAEPALAGASFHYETWDIDAEDEAKDNDYVYTHGDYNVPVDSTKITISVPINGDTKIEDDESFYFGISNLVNLTLSGSSRTTGVILNDDGSFPNLTFDSSIYSISEGNSGIKDLNFTLTLDQPALAGSSFDYYTQDATAQVGDNDYVALSTTTHTFVGGENNVTISVQINGDTTIEDSETFYLKINNEVNLTLGSTGVQGEILNDDGDYPTITFDQLEYSIIEGDMGSKDLNFTFTLDDPALADTQMDYYTEEITAQDGSDSSKDSDYVATSGTLLIPSGRTTASIIVKINGDKNIEPNETFYLHIKNIVNLKMSVTKVKTTIENDDEHNEEPFICDENMYLSSSIKRGSIETGKMWLHRIDTGKTPFGFEVMDDLGELKLYNALAYSSEDNYIYGLYKKELIKLSKTGKVISLGNVDDLPSILTTKQLFAGAMFGSEYYISGPGQDYDKIFKISIPDKNVSEITLDTAISLLDFSFTPDGKHLHGIVDGGKLVKVNVDQNSSDLGKVTFIGDAHTGYQFDSTFSDTNGRFFANDSLGNGFFEFNLNTGEKHFLSDSQPADYNDGANCLGASLSFMDYGDAPISYGKAWHQIANGIHLGTEVDHDVDDFDTLYADGDDKNGIDDEDGVTLIDGSDINGTYFDINTTHQLKVTLSKEGYLKLWIDLDINGHFSDAKDLVYNSGVALSAGTHTIDFTLPDTLETNKITYLRARVSSHSNLNPVGFISDGEVEDYAIFFGSATPPLRGLFNIERIGSAVHPINSELRNAWYTQTVGRDFDYSIIFYEEDWSSERVVDNVTVKLELINQNDNRVLYERYAHIKNTIPRSRINITIPADDLAHLPATKDTIFKISYGVDADGVIIQADCDEDPRICYSRLSIIKTDSAQDNFAIRPETFHLSIEDNLTHLKDSRSIDKSPLRLASGYNYTLNVTATQYQADNTLVASADYNTSVTRWLRFKNSGSCASQKDDKVAEDFKDGLNSVKLMEFQNVGLYTLELKDENWTAVDQNSLNPDLAGCIMGSGERIPNANGKIGCNIKAYTSDMNLSFYPHHFNVNLAMNNLPIGGSHPDFIYMSKLHKDYNGVAIQFNGEITAQSADDENCTNFIAGCAAEDILLALNADVISEDGLNQQLQTSFRHDLTPTRENISITRMARFNNEDLNASHFSNVVYITNELNITANKFEAGEHNGSSFIDLRYNIDKHLSRTINPIQITFNSLDVNSSSSRSNAEGVAEMYTPMGSHLFTSDNVRQFYFTQVAPDKINYPRINCNIVSTIRTPLNVDIFCDKNSTYCEERNITGNSDISSSPRQQDGWNLSLNHDTQIDGNVTMLTASPDIVSITPSRPITFTKGRNGIVMTKFDDCVDEQSSTIRVKTDESLLYSPNFDQNGENEYTVNSTDIDPSSWTGVGSTGNTMEGRPNVNSRKKMEW